jgi:hypothetical protein
MVERIFARGESKTQIISELQSYRTDSANYVHEVHSEELFIPLSALLASNEYGSLIDKQLLHKAMNKLALLLSEYGPYELLDPARIWVGVAMPDNTIYFGGFYHHYQGYRYLQQIAMTSLSGTLARHPVDRTLTTFELIRAYTHDTLHHNSYRLFYPLPHKDAVSFYRFQYGINFRKWTGVTYSAKDSVRSKTTRNLGNIMEAATDRFAHELVLSLAQEIHYNPLPIRSRDLCCYPCPDPVYDYVYRDCTGQLTDVDMSQLREIERGQLELITTPNFKSYLKSMRLFVQYVTMRYRQFLAEVDPEQHYQLHRLIIQSMLSGQMRELCKVLDSQQCSKKSFVSLFKWTSF